MCQIKIAKVHLNDLDLNNIITGIVFAILVN